ncbi:hypothetical protein BT96DRAFT_22437 [Gymnopus androsaceus JB14]|uniref:Uncharacterized protein n=1 Tax=Gymnopus androsaceus JB14 TaxID=1447944 RepID=A0A6A4IC32_9AGAR|nr:hypothetical protein BT96DRAFT_22437 [Gymnopus androsaceus JB14]
MYQSIYRHIAMLVSPHPRKTARKTQTSIQFIAHHQIIACSLVVFPFTCMFLPDLAFSEFAFYSLFTVPYEQRD